MVMSKRMIVGCASMVLAAGPAIAIGPDVVVSTIGPTLTRYGTTNGVTGYSATTVSCNIGDANAIWIDSTDLNNPNRNKHPVIGQQLYRLHNGKFEQIGMSWLKHGFCAADAPHCTNLAQRPNPAYVPNNSCDWLGLYATDTYSAGLNGAQNTLGPRSEINAATGAYPYPYVLNWNATGNCTYKRLQIANVDLDPTMNLGARYFLEVHYITTDEANDVRANNASYRELIVGPQATTGNGCASDGAGYTLSFPNSNPTVPLKPALLAWSAIDPAVSVTSIDIPNDGRVMIGTKVTDLGNGTWSYEYAVYNHNSDRSISSFAIPKPSSSAATFSSVGFHDVSYHSGEPFSGTDWASTVSPGSSSPSSVGTIRWNTEDFAVNPNANAIRWSTTYNFRFISNRPPVGGTDAGAVTLGLFKPGVDGDPTTINVPGIIVPSTPCPADFNQVGGVTVQDIFDYLGAYFVADTSADFNGADGVTVQDLFDFITAFFTGC